MRRFTYCMCCVLVLAAGVAPAEEHTDGGAVISVQVGDGGDTTIDVARGELKVRAAGEETRVSAGERVLGERGKPARHLLHAPTGLVPANGATLPTLAFVIRWNSVPRASSYRIVVARDANLSSVVLKDDHVAATQLSARVAQAGTYWWRVMAFDDKSQLAGKPSAACKLVIDTTPPKLKAGQPRWK